MRLWNENTFKKNLSPSSYPLNPEKDKGDLTIISRRFCLAEPR
jgi:hypothetical protein